MAADTPPDRTRLDRAMVTRGLVATRSRAQDLIRRGLVTVDGAVEASPARAVTPAQHVALTDAPAATRHVSRGGEKLAAALAAFKLEAQGRAALDIGASTGGFTRVLLDAGAARVYAIDVGHGQLHPSLSGDPRVVAREGSDARDLTPADIAEPVGAVVVDVSFISLLKVLPAVLPLAARGAWLVALIKPQFEVGRAAVGKRGIVRDAKARQAAVTAVEQFLAGQPGWRLLGVVPSPITGGSGNLEYLIGASHDA
ncbi:MAG: TlyA family RNA methyltransferase [Hyphomicrobiaceae bacterium]|nr:TlyA family RNA methyltransferase [Hyphomicrobiaceae bacterium]